MTSPRHLWSGDWQRESAEAAEQLAQRGDTGAARAEPPAEPPPHPRSSELERLLASLRTAGQHLLVALRQTREKMLAALREANRPGLRRGILTGVAMLIAAVAAFAVVSALRSPGTSDSAGTKRSAAISSSPAWLGVDLANFPLANGAMITDLAPGSPAAAAGLEPGDVITEINGQPVRSSADVLSALAGLHSGQQVQIGYQRGPSSYTAQVTLQPRPSGP